MNGVWSKIRRVRSEHISVVVERLRVETIFLLVLGIALLANPLYLDELSAYPLVGWADMPLFVAGLTVLGLLCVGVSVVAVVGSLDDPRVVFGVGLLSVPGFALYLGLLPLVWQPSTDPITGFFFTQLFIGSLVAGAFVAGALGRGRKRWGAGGMLAIVTPFLVLYLLDWGFAAQLEPIVDLSTFLTDDRVLSVPYFGSVIVIVAFVLGVRTSSVEGVDR